MARHTPPRIGTASRAGRERMGVFLLAGFIVTAVGLYLALNAAGGRSNERGLLPYQALARTLPEAEQQQFRALRSGLLAAEAERARTGRWPDAAALAARGIAPFTADDGGEGRTPYRWERFQQGTTVDYMGSPADPSRPAWLLSVQEPDPGALADPAPDDDEHHRLPDGTVLHVYVWMHHYGGQVPVSFAPQPQSAGWIEIFSAPPNPVPSRR